VPFLDTNVLLDVTGSTKGKYLQAARNAIRSATAPGESLYTSRFNVTELLLGVELCDDPVAERRRVDAALEGVIVLEFDEPAALRYAKIAARLRRSGKPTGVMDLLVAAVALEINQIFVTRNPKHFANITELTLISY
jgi:tRNA(fMet)-specific endonuclease VapC